MNHEGAKKNNYIYKWYKLNAIEKTEYKWVIEKIAVELGVVKTIGERSRKLKVETS